VFAAGVTAPLTVTRRAEAGDPSFMNNVPELRIEEPSEYKKEDL
jgi:hypothetical protein